MQLVRRLYLPALFCSIAVLICELISHPAVKMGICDDGPYILMARTLATTGHIVFNGWAAPMLGWQLYLGAAFIKLFGFSFTVVRSCTLFVAMVMAFILQRTLVRSGITERNATLGTLALVLSPLYLMLSVTYMTDIFGLFAIVICLYGCLGALQASTTNATIAWLCFAVIANALCGTARQIAWLGILVMLPSTLWLLRSNRRILLAGSAATLAGVLFIFACMQWLKHQPYTIPIPLRLRDFPIAHAAAQLIYFFLDIPFLLLPIFALFLPQIRKSTPRVAALLSTPFLLYFLLASTLRTHHVLRLEPTGGDWVTIHGFFDSAHIKGEQPIFLHKGVQILLTLASLGSLVGLAASLLRLYHAQPAADPSFAKVSTKQLAVLIAPFTLAYILFLVSAFPTTSFFFDRYVLGLLVMVIIALIRFYQEQIHSRLPSVSILLLLIMAIYGIVVTHNLFSFYRARVALAAELNAHGVPDTSIENGWEIDLLTELQHADHLNDPHIVVPANSYVPPVPLPEGTCEILPYWSDKTPHIHPLFGASFDPNACYGPAPFAPVQYSHWLSSSPNTLYIVRYTPPSKP